MIEITLPDSGLIIVTDPRSLARIAALVPAIADECVFSIRSVGAE